jgi:nucleotide-binding universal stress UspA family protein
MTAMLSAGDQPEQATRDEGGRVIVGVDDTPGGLAALSRAVELARSADMPLVASPGPVLTQLVSAAGDVLVVGTTPGHSLKRLLHGSVSACCASHLPAQVSVVRYGGGGHAGARG